MSIQPGTPYWACTEECAGNGTMYIQATLNGQDIAHGNIWLKQLVKNANEVPTLLAQRDALLEALGEIVGHCANAGLPNEIVADRVVDRCDDTARAAIALVREGRMG